MQAWQPNKYQVARLASWQALVVLPRNFSTGLRSFFGGANRTWIFFHLALAVFLFTAGVAVWASYDRPAAWLKFGWIMGAIGLFYLLAWQPRKRLWLIAAIISVFAFLLAAYFLLGYDWRADPVKIEFVSRVAEKWMAFRLVRLPAGLPMFETDAVAAVLALLFPLSIVFVVHEWQASKKRRLWARLAGLISVTILWAIFLTAERGVWLGLTAVCGIWLWWKISAWVSRLIFSTEQEVVIRKGHNTIFGTGFGLLLVLIFIVVVTFPGGLNAFASLLPGPAEAGSREDVWSSTIKLVQDFPFTGGGLASFPGLYSQYVLAIPYKFLENSHNLFLEVAVEQGIIGLFALIGIFVGSIILLLKQIFASPDEYTLLRGAVLAGLLALIAHGLIENSLYGGAEVLFLFLLPGLAIVLTIPGVRQVTEAKSFKPAAARWGFRPFVLPLVILIPVAVSLVFFGRSIFGLWEANLGAVRMARIQLAGFPRNVFDNGQYLPELVPVETLLNQALQFNPNLRSVNYRLGLIDMLQGDFPAATAHLERAYQLDLQTCCDVHRGIYKTLAYSYIWDQKYAQALPLLRKLPEADNELKYYEIWWKEQGRKDLALVAREMLDLLDGVNGAKS